MASPSAPACASPLKLKGSPIISLSPEDFHGNATEKFCVNQCCSDAGTYEIQVEGVYLYLYNIHIHYFRWQGKVPLS